jgi:sulfur carrier protein ThiS
VRIHLGGHLAWYVPGKRSWVAFQTAEPIALIDLLRQLGVPEAEVAVATVNRRAVELETARATDADTVEFFPPVGGGSLVPHPSPPAPSPLS